MKKSGVGVCVFSCMFTSLISLGLAIAMLVIIVTGLLQDTLDEYVRKETTLEPGHETYEQWLNPSVPTYKDFYVYNLINPEEFVNGAKPSFEELGPYRYRETRQKTVLEQGDGTITYVMNRTFHFEENSNYSESDLITTINFVYVAAIYFAEMEEGLEEYLQFLINSNLDPVPELLIETTVHELIWEYNDTLLDLLHSIQLAPPLISLHLNNSYSDRELPSIVHSGTEDSLKRAQFIQWANLTELPFWRNEANFINKSTEGLLFHPIIQQSDMLEAFISDANRTFHLSSSEKVSVDGVDAYRYRVIDSDFLPDPNYHTDNSTPNGLIFLGVLQTPEAPVYGSKPHFLDCNESLREAVEGITPPDRSVHDIVVDVEPITGSTINVHQQLQIIFDVHQTTEYFEPFFNITSVYFPLFYSDEHATLDDDLKSKLNKLVFTPIRAIKASSWVAFGLFCFISILTGLCTIGWFVKLSRYSKRTGYSELTQKTRA